MTGDERASGATQVPHEQAAAGGSSGKAAPAQAETPLIGLTGAMGAGKSTALAAMRELGAEVLSTDSVVHQLYHCDRVKAALEGRWGADVAPDGVVDRQAVAERAFASDDELSWLEHTLWPLVGERIAVWLALTRARSPAPRAAVVEMPLLFESGMDRACDATIALVVGEELRQIRAKDRGHARAGERAARQLSQEEKAQRATFVVANDGTVAGLREQLSSVLEQLCG